MITNIKKRSGEIVEFDAAKLNLWAEWAAGFGVEWGSVVLGATRKCFDGCTSDDLQTALISECVDRETIPHLRMAGRLFMGVMYKKAFGSWKSIPTLTNMYHKMSALGLWADMDYTDPELEYLNSFMNHDLDLQATYSESKQIMDKYAITDRVGRIFYETPQFVYMRMALGNMENMPKDRRLNDVATLYSYLSQKKINAPTPFMINLGTPKKQYASCCVSTTLDTAPSLAVQDHIAYLMTCASAGIGSHIKSRSKGDKVRGGLVQHMGKLPYYKVQQAVVAANLQSSRGGANTMHFNVMDPELLDLLALKNVQTVEQKRIKDIDYSVGYNAEFARRVAKNEKWMLVSYGDSRELYESMYSGDQTEFVRLYSEVEFDDNIHKQFVNARDIALKMLTEGVETGRVYLHRTDEMNRHTPFKDKIYSSNLCQEVGLPTEGYPSVVELYKDDGIGEIGLCSLAAIIAGNVKASEHEDVAYYAVLMIDNVIDIMEYPFPNLATSARARRSIGVGITNLAYDLAKNGFKYSSIEGKQYIHRLAEMHSFFLHKASLRLAKERGVCDWIGKTKYPDGWLPIDTANSFIDEVVKQPLMQDWETLREEIIAVGGLRNSVLEAYMPCESSSGSSNTTNGPYPIRAFKVVKTSGKHKNLFIAPELDNLKDHYELAWDIPTVDLLDVYGIIQKFTGQGISADLYIKYDKDGDRKVGAKELLTQFLYMTKIGMKSRYYINSSTGVDLAMNEETGTSCDSCSL
jgi:ribonucleoside-diphosphate reductase alpha subunit